MLPQLQHQQQQQQCEQVLLNYVRVGNARSALGHATCESGGMSFISPWLCGVCAPFCLLDRKRKAQQQQQQWQQQQLRFANTKLNWATLANVRHVSINPAKSTFWPCLWQLSPSLLLPPLPSLGHFLNGSTGFGGRTKNANNKFISISQQSHRENKQENKRSSCINQFPYNCISGWQKKEKKTSK